MLENNKMTGRFSRTRGETRGGRIKGVVAKRGSSVYKQKQEFDEQP